MKGPRDPRAGVPALSRPPAGPAAFVLELPATPDFEPGGLGYQCSVSCKAGCCKYFSLPLETPRTDADYDDLRWYLMHEGTHVYKSEGDWYLLVHNECKNLLPNNLCAVYETRPRICREYDPTDCEFTGEVKFELYFDSSAKLEEFLLERQAKLVRRAATRKSSTPKAARGGKAARTRTRA